MPMIWLFALLLAATAFFNLAEMALVAVRSSTLAASDDPRASRALRLKQRPGLFLAAIRAGDLLTDLLTGAFVVTTLDGALRQSLAGLPMLGGSAAMIGTVAAFAIVSFLVLVFGDLAPKSIALAAPERAALLVAAPLRLFIVAAQPFFLLLEWSNTLVLGVLGIKRGDEAGVTQAEIRRTLAEGLSAGALLSTERSMMERVLDLERRSVRTVMTGRPFVQALRIDGSTEAIREAALDAKASRLLVMAADREEPIGIVMRADILATLSRGGTLDLRGSAKPIRYVVENASVLSALQTLKDGGVGLAVVVDEYGSMLGIITFADVLEAIAGEIAVANPEDVDGDDGSFRPEPDGSFIIAGSQPIDDLVEELHLAVPPGRTFKTIAGMVIDRARCLPPTGESFVFDGFSVEVMEVDGGSIVSLRLSLSKPSSCEMRQHHPTGHEDR
jgi:putative hemolysin